MNDKFGLNRYLYHYNRSGSSSQPIWSRYMSSSSSDTCYSSSNSCPSTSITSCTHSEDITVTCSTFKNFFKNVIHI